MKFTKVRKAFLNDIINKYKNQYLIDLKSWFPNPYYTLKYKFICEVASFISYFFLKLKLTANTVTMINLLLGILALMIFAMNISELKIIGLLIFFSKQILDNVDGFIARVNKSSSGFGKNLDAICGHVYYHSIFFSLAFHNYYIFENVIFIYLGFLALLLDILVIKNKKTKKRYNLNNKYLSLNNLYILLKAINYDGRTKKTDLILLLILIETFIFPLSFSFLLIFLFLIPKILRNFYLFYKIII